MLNQKIVATLLLSLVFTTLSWASGEPQDGHQLVQNAYKVGTTIEFDEDQDEVYDAVQKGLIRPFSELYATVDKQLNGRLIKVELEEDDDEWIYELKLVHDSHVIKVEYNATTLELIQIKGRNLHDFIKK